MRKQIYHNKPLKIEQNKNNTDLSFGQNCVINERFKWHKLINDQRTKYKLVYILLVLYIWKKRFFHSQKLLSNN